ncbi:ATP-dependent RNA helicase DDX54 [Pelomyxa schiedti]|nr:ATP-dependent RNA helicase DDX54 [Pelomyxa schiedti]
MSSDSTFSVGDIIIGGDGGGKARKGSDDILVSPQQAKKRKGGGFQSMGLSKPVLQGVIKRGYLVPTPIQRLVIPQALKGLDVVAMARTGSGKTAAFLIPLLNALGEHSSKSGARGLILSPTRELAVQTLRFAKQIGKFTNITLCLLVGGESLDDQFSALTTNPDILIGTPGRAAHVVKEVGMTLTTIQCVIFDEADRLFEMGFASQLKDITSALSTQRQTMLFSATLPQELVEFSRAGLHDPVFVRLDIDTKLSPDLQNVFLLTRSDTRDATLLFLLQKLVTPEQQTIIFTSTRHHTEYVHTLLLSFGIDNTLLYGTMDPTARKINLAKFREQKVNVLVVTDIAARGVDLPRLDNSINYHFPGTPRLFVHRVGRVARAGRKGVAYSIVGPEDVAHMLDLMLFLGTVPTAGTPPSEKNTLSNESMQLEESGKSSSKSTAQEEEPSTSSSTTTSSAPAGSSGTRLCHYGVVPDCLVDDFAEQVKLRLQEIELSTQVKSCNNAYKLYMKTRPLASMDSAKRAKSLPKDAVHPILLPFIDSKEENRRRYVDSLKSFKPKETVLEVNYMTRGKKTAGSIAMEELRVAHADTILAKQRRLALEAKQLEEEKALKAYDDRVDAVPSTSAQRSAKLLKLLTTTKQSEFYLNPLPPVNAYEKGLQLDKTTSVIDGMAVTLNPDETDQLKKPGMTRKWDRRHKKFVVSHGGMEAQKSSKTKTESGAVTYKKTKPGFLYEQWKRKSGMKNAGGEEDYDEQGSAGYGRKRPHSPSEREGRARGPPAKKSNFTQSQPRRKNDSGGLKTKEQRARELRKEDKVRAIKEKHGIPQNGRKGKSKGSKQETKKKPQQIRRQGRGAAKAKIKSQQKKGRKKH